MPQVPVPSSAESVTFMPSTFALPASFRIVRAWRGLSRAAVFGLLFAVAPLTVRPVFAAGPAGNAAAMVATAALNAPHPATPVVAVPSPTLPAGGGTTLTSTGL